jgi:hypothetical protein
LLKRAFLFIFSLHDPSNNFRTCATTRPGEYRNWDAGFALKLEGIYFEKMLYRTSPSRFTPSEEKLI